MKKSFWGRAAVAGVGAALLIGVGGAAMAATEGDVDVNVDIESTVTPGSLALTVAAGDVSLAENGTTSEWRQFTGTLPTVTVTDTRDASEVPDGAAWYVVGSSSSFTATEGQPEISAAHLGWAPRLVQASDEGLVSEGDPVDTVLDDGPNNVGLVDQEILALAADSGAIAHEGSWAANADLFLRTPVNVAPGSYTATLTLSLFE